MFLCKKKRPGGKGSKGADDGAEADTQEALQEAEAPSEHQEQQEEQLGSGAAEEGAAEQWHARRMGTAIAQKLGDVPVPHG